MRGSAAFRAAVAPGGALAGPWVKNELWRRAKAVPSLDLRFAENKSLVDATTGSNLVTFTRASSGTFVGSDGLIRTAVTNLLLRSEEFDNASWQDGTTSLTITANALEAPNGTLTADQVTTAATPLIARLRQNVTTVAAIHTFSIWARSITGTQWTRFWIGTGTGDAGIWVELSTQWQRYNFSATLSAGTRPVLAAAVTANQSTTFQGNASIALWGAQLEQSSTVGEYIPTTSTINSAPRFDHNPTTGESLGLLVEEQRTNLLVRSEEFETTWDASNLTVSANTADTAAPTGLFTADKITGSSSTSNIKRISQSLTLSAIAYTFGVFAKAVNQNFIQLRTFTDFGVIYANFDISNGTVGSSSGVATANTQAVGNGWYKCWITFTPSAATSSISLNFITSLTSSSPQNTTLTTSLYLWGAQLEAGAFPTSYIPTTTATVTRSADVCSISGSNFSSWLTSFGENTFYTEYAKPPNVTGTLVEGFDGNTIVGITLNTTNNNRPRVTVRHGSSRHDSGTTNLPEYLAGNNKLAGGTSASGSASASNGTLFIGGSPAQSDWTATASIGIGYRGSFGPTSLLNGTIRRLTYWPTRLANSTLQSITQ